MAKVLIVGDSISMGYAPTVVAELADVATAEHAGTNGGDCSNVIAHIDGWLANVRPHIVTVNCGLHDLRLERATGHHQVPLDFYKLILPSILEKIRSAGCRAFWVTTTPVLEGRLPAGQDFDRSNADVDAYNKAARYIANQAGVPIIDLHKAAVALGLETALGDDGVHFTTDAYVALGKKVAARLREEWT